MYTTYVATTSNHPASGQAGTRYLTRSGSVLSAMWAAHFYDDDEPDDDETASHVQGVLGLALASPLLTDEWAAEGVRYPLVERDPRLDRN